MPGHLFPQERERSHLGVDFYTPPMPRYIRHARAELHHDGDRIELLILAQLPDEQRWTVTRTWEDKHGVWRYETEEEARAVWDGYIEQGKTRGEWT